MDRLVDYLTKASSELRAAPVEALNDLVASAGIPCGRFDCDGRKMPWTDFVAQCGNVNIRCCFLDCQEAVEAEYREGMREQSEERTADANREHSEGILP